MSTDSPAVKKPPLKRRLLQLAAALALIAIATLLVTLGRSKQTTPMFLGELEYRPDSAGQNQ